MNTINTGTYSDVWRKKYYSTKMQIALRNALVAEKICEVDRSGSYYITNPYINQGTAKVSATDGSYSISAWTTTEDSLTVSDEVTKGAHVYDFEKSLANYNLFAARVDEQAYAVAAAIDKYVLNNLLEAGTGTYTTPAGGFTTSANIPVIVSNLISKVMGYADAYKGLFLVIENTDVPGFIQSGAASGFNFADMVLNNGFMTNYMGVEIYVVRSGVFDDGSAAEMGSTTWTNDGHRLFGVKGVSTYANPGGIKYEEKGVTLKTGMEIVNYGYVGVKLWTQKASLIVDITLA